MKLIIKLRDMFKNSSVRKLYLAFPAILIPLLSELNAFAAPDGEAFVKAYNSFEGTIKFYINIILAFAFLIGVLAGIVLLIRLARYGTSNPRRRAEVVSDFIVLGVTMSIIGSFGLFMNLLYAIIF